MPQELRKLPSAIRGELSYETRTKSGTRDNLMCAVVLEIHRQLKRVSWTLPDQWSSNNNTDQLGSLAQHLGGNVAGDHVSHVRGEAHCCVSCACGNVESVPMGLRLDQFNKPGEASTAAVNFTFGVGFGRGAELLLSDGLGH